MDIERWAENLIQDTYDKWCEFSKWESGFKVFYSPIHKNPPIMILSLNPGGSVKDFLLDDDCKQYKQNNFAVQNYNSYTTTNHKMSKAVREFFKEHHTLLKKSVIMPILFFRSKNIHYWKTEFTKLYSENERNEIELFCYSKTIETIRKIKPKSLFIIGFNTFERLTENGFLLPITIEKIGYGQYGKNKQRNYYIANWNDIPIFCVRHLSRAILSNEDKPQIRYQFDEFLKRNNIM